MTTIPPPQREPGRCSSPFTGGLKWPVCVGVGGKREIRRSAQNYLVTSTDAMIGISDLLQGLGRRLTPHIWSQSSMGFKKIFISRYFEARESGAGSYRFLGTEPIFFLLFFVLLCMRPVIPQLRVYLTFDSLFSSIFNKI